MTNVKKIGCAAALLALFISVGCGEGGGGSSGAAGPSSEQAAAGQKANTGGQAITQTEGIATEAVVEAGAPGTTSTKSGGGVSMAPTTTFNFQGTVSVTVDLDTLNSSGQDMFPNATGRFTVDATGTITGDEFNGEANYAVTVTWITDGTFTDPVCSESATIASGSSWNYTLHVQWSRADDLNWSIEATSDVDGQANGSVTGSAGQTWTFTGTVQRHATVSFSRVAGVYQFAFGVNGEKTIIVSRGAESHSVVITMSALDHILITVDGVTFGPYTAFQVWLWWHFNCNG